EDAGHRYFSPKGIKIPHDLLDTRRILSRIDNQLNTSSEPQLSFNFPVQEVDEQSQPISKEHIVDLPTVVVSAYLDVRQGASTDLVIANPDLNARFVQKCWLLGGVGSADVLNVTLLNARKNGLLAGLPPAEKFSIPRDSLDEYVFASEFALRL